MRPAHPTERSVGIEYYVSDGDGTGGRLRAQDDHFRVREREQFSTEPVDSSPDAYPELVVRATLTGWDTNDFAAALSDAVGISRERVSWAGTKDKRAVTTQLFSIRDVEPADLPTLSNADIEVVGRAGRSLTFGDLAGNEFEIVVSDPDDPTAAGSVRDALADFGGAQSAPADADSVPSDSTTVGVPNFFGQQRFGSYRPITHEVGLAILRDDWEGAVMAYLGNPHEAEPASTREAREFLLETRDWDEALDRYPGHLRYERSLLHVLAESDSDPDETTFREALGRFPSNLQRLFVHAAQSYAFNLMLSERLDRGLPFDRPVAGDVVCFIDTDAPDGLVVPDPDRTQRVTDRRVDSVTRHCDRGRAFITAPLVGTDTDLADGEQGEIERTVLQDLSLEHDDFDLPDPYRSSGTRRAILVRTDLSIRSEPLTLSFGLPSGAYATVVLREFLKSDPVSLG
ncbi:tRNA pseudouridine synthase D [Halovivax asiaticus JCM 14624]|uniref:Probable tRNA pseudouridine synthase D n=1 Tax=Halovivax asiaticus JCM 14624 TaxID=1227490 RepID=M0BTL0_9EURY|nr:tRNA pseudouridine(13) synthase TruD [Halovivax asiaticus]ELZ13733.1 tRNA pseudouridine synthase D [Halovivax asiaticus JCM 14624]